MKNRGKDNLGSLYCNTLIGVFLSENKHTLASINAPCGAHPARDPTKKRSPENSGDLFQIYYW